MHIYQAPPSCLSQLGEGLFRCGVSGSTALWLRLDRFEQVFGVFRCLSCFLWFRGASSPPSAMVAQEGRGERDMPCAPGFKTAWAIPGAGIGLPGRSWRVILSRCWAARLESHVFRFLARMPARLQAGAAGTRR